MTVAYVLSGGASLGSVQVGMAQALYEADIVPDLVVGTSVGAVNGSWLAGEGHPDELADIWRQLDRGDLFPFDPWTGLQAFAGRTHHFVPDRGLRRLLERHRRFDRIEDAPISLLVVAADATTGEEVVIDRGPMVEAVLASAAIPAVYPPVTLDGRLLIDGGVVDNTPITKAIEAGASEVWVLTTGYSCGLDEPPDSAFAVAMHAVALLVQQRLVLETRGRDYPVPVRLVPPPCPITVTPIDFTETEALIDAAATGTRQWLADGMPDALPVLGLHQH